MHVIQHESAGSHSVWSYHQEVLPHQEELLKDPKRDKVEILELESKKRQVQEWSHFCCGNKLYERGI